MKAKKFQEPIRKPHPDAYHFTSHLKEQRLHELDRGYLRQLRQLRRIVWSAKLKRETTSKHFPS